MWPRVRGAAVSSMRGISSALSATHVVVCSDINKNHKEINSAGRSFQRVTQDWMGDVVRPCFNLQGLCDRKTTEIHPKMFRV